MPKWTAWQVIYADNWSAEFKNIVRKRIPYSASLIEDTMHEVRQELAISLAELTEAPHAINAYLRTAFRNTLEDYLRKKDGYPRPPEWIKRLGAAYERIYKLLCLENRAVNDIHASLESLYQYSREFIEQVIAEVRVGVTNCGAWRESVSLDNVISEVEVSDNQKVTTPEDVLQDMDSVSVCTTILGERPATPEILHSSNFATVLKKLQQCNLDDDARLLLRMVYTDGHSVSKAARLLNLPDAKARKLLKNTLKVLRQTLRDAGINEI